MPFTGLAASHQIKHQGDTKFCHGDCQKELPLSEFPKKPARYCKKCTSKKANEKHHSRKAEREMYF